MNLYKLGDVSCFHFRYWEKRMEKKIISCTCPDSTQRFQLLHFKLRDTELSSCLFAPFLAQCALLSVLPSLALISVCDSCWGARTFVYTCVWPMSSTAHPPVFAISLGYRQVFLFDIFLKSDIWVGGTSRAPTAPCLPRRGEFGRPSVIPKSGDRDLREGFVVL